jgi:nickel-dependent lactate racemase
MLCLERAPELDWLGIPPRAPGGAAPPLEEALARALAGAWEAAGQRQHGRNGPAARRGRTVIVVPDGTRRFPHRAVTRAVLAFLAARGQPAGRALFLVAGGVHAGPPPGDLASEVGRGGAALRVHGADAEGESVGETSAGTPVALARDYLEAELRMAIGGTSFHYFAGYGGGPKLVFPGLATRPGVLANHRLALGPLPPGGLAEGCEPGRTAGNPVAADIAEAETLAAPEISLHLVAWGDGWRVEPGPAGLERARALVRRSGASGPRRAADCVLASAGGSPLDGDLVQAHKALYHASLYAREGGAILLAAGLARGSGSPALERWLEVRALDELEERARRAYDLNAQTAVSLRRICARHPVYWLGARSPRWVRRAGAEVVPDGAPPWAEIERAARASGEWKRGVYLPLAPAVVPADAPHGVAPAA